jgi:hypothetical protein
MATSMTSTADNNGGPETGSLSLAEKLMQKHAADESHRPTVEDVEDEEDIAHPPPSSTTQHGTLSEKAAGKQPMQDAGQNDKAKPPNIQSEEAFPSLGGPKTRAPVSAAAWNKRPTEAYTNGANGSSNGVAVSSTTSSRASTPASSGVGTPNAQYAGAGHQRGNTMQNLNLPGRHVERYSLQPSQLIPRTQLKKPVKDVLNDINKRSKAKVSMKEAAGNIVFEAQGPTPEDVRTALKEVVSQVGAKV